MSDRLVALALLAVTGVLFWQTFSFRKPPFAQFDAFDAATFPRIVLGALALCLLALLVRGNGPVVPRFGRARLAEWLDRYKLPLISLPLFAVYAIAMPRLGWTISTIAYLIAMQLILLPRRGRSLLVLAAGSVAFTLAVSAAFERLLRIVLPRPDLF